eukprot:s2261_g19.t1
MLHRRVRQECSAFTAMSMRGGSPSTGDATDSDLRQIVARLEDELAAERTARRLMEDELAVECNARETLAGRVNVLEATVKRMKEMQVKNEDDVNATCSTTSVAAQPSTPATSSPQASVVRIASPTAPIALTHWTNVPRMVGVPQQGMPVSAHTGLPTGLPVESSAWDDAEWENPAQEVPGYQPADPRRGSPRPKMGFGRTKCQTLNV